MRGCRAERARPAASYSSVVQRAGVLARRLVIAGSLSIPLWITACVAAFDSLLEGTVGVETAEYGAWRYTPDRCFSGERLQFFGVDLVEGEPELGRITRIVEDPVEGISVSINVPDEDLALVFTGEGCERFDVSLWRENSRVNEIWNISGFADIQCDGQGVRLNVDASFENCH